jgi:Spy/CpxP family protein refolding chaperone
MKIKRLSLVAALALALGAAMASPPVATAQDSNASGKNRRMTPEQQLERLTTELNLTDAQKPKVKELLEDGAKKRQELRGLGQDERREKMRALMQDQNKKLKEILTPEQREKYQKMMERRRQRGGGGAGGQSGGASKKTN